MTDQEIDVEALRSELTQIKDAMGIRERNEDALEFWLYVGAIVVVASALSQYVHLQRLPGWYFTLIWGGLFAVFFLVVRLGAFDEPDRYWGGDGKPDLFVLFLFVWLASVPIQVVFAETGAYAGYVETSARILGLALVLIGVGYAVAGNVLKAYYIRRRDRWAFYVGALWLVVLGSFTPHVPFLRTWGYAVFGGCYGTYALAVYALLGGFGDE